MPQDLIDDQVSIGSGNGLVVSAIIWANVDPEVQICIKRMFKIRKDI